MAAVLLGVDVLAGGGQVSGEFADDLLEDVLQRHQPQHVAVFVHHDADAPPRVLEIDQLAVQRRAFRHEVGLHRVLHQLRFVDVFLEQQPAQFAQVQQAQHVVGVAAVDGQPGVLAGAQGGHDLIHVVVDVHAHHLVARDHDVFHGDAFQIQDIEQHLLVLFRDQAAGLVDHGAQFLGAEVVVVAVAGLGAGQLQEHHADAVDQPHQRRQQHLQGLEHHAGGEGDALGLERGVGFRGDFREHQHHQGDHHRRHRRAAVA